MLKYIDIYSIFLFAGIIIFPVSQLKKADNEILLLENRSISAFPKFEHKSFFEGAFFRKVENFVNDRIPFRIDMISLKNEMKYNYYRDNAALLPQWNGVILGDSGWLFLARTFEERPPVQDIDQFAVKLLVIQRMVEKRNKKFLFFIAPDKNRIYPEFLPSIASIVYTNMDYPINDIYEVLSKTGINYINIHDIFHESKSEIFQQPFLYFQDGDHWSGYGTSIVVQRLFSALELDLNEDFLPKPVEYKINPNGHLFRLLGIANFHSYLQKTSFSEPRNPILLPENSGETGNTFLLIGDSFARSCILSYMLKKPESELKLWNFHNVENEYKTFKFIYHADCTPDMLKRTEFNVVIFECAERLLPEYFSVIQHLADQIAFPSHEND